MRWSLETVIKREKRHAEPKAQRVIPFGILKDAEANSSWKLAEFLYLGKCSTEVFGIMFRKELIKKIVAKYK